MMLPTPIAAGTKTLWLFLLMSSPYLAEFYKYTGLFLHIPTLREMAICDFEDSR